DQPETLMLDEICPRLARPLFRREHEALAEASHRRIPLVTKLDVPACQEQYLARGLVWGGFGIGYDGLGVEALHVKVRRRQSLVEGRKSLPAGVSVSVP